MNRARMKIVEYACSCIDSALISRAVGCRCVCSGGPVRGVEATNQFDRTIRTGVRQLARGLYTQWCPLRNRHGELFATHLLSYAQGPHSDTLRRIHVITCVLVQVCELYSRVEGHVGP